MCEISHIFTVLFDDDKSNVAFSMETDDTYVSWEIIVHEEDCQCMYNVTLWHVCIMFMPPRLS
jgi:hypothetical protein